MSSAKPRILCVDDEQKVLDGLRRTLRREFDVEVVLGGAAGLRQLEQDDSITVVVSDLRMPKMDGIEFLTRVRQTSPDVTRILLTGNADLGAAVSAVNEGNIFRFLSKPCPADTLIQALNSAVDLHMLVIAERELLQKTLLGSVKMLTEVLAMANPTAFGRATRIKQKASALAKELGEPQVWEMEMAAMLSQAAYVTLPGETLERIYRGDPLEPAEQEMVDDLPNVSEAMLGSIPRIQNVRDIITHHTASPGDAADPDAVPLGARILRAVIDLDIVESQDIPESAALDVLNARNGAYDPAVLAALATASAVGATEQVVSEVSVAQLRVGMVLLEAATTPDGRLLVARGQEVSKGLRARLSNFEVKEPLRVSIPDSAGND